MATKTSSTARWARLAATTAGIVMAAASAHAQTGSDLLGLQPGRQNNELFTGPRFQVNERAPEQSLIIRPRVGARLLATDNAYLTPTDRVSDLVTSALVGVTVTTRGPRTAGELDLATSYDSYARAHQLNGWSYSGYGSGQFDIVSRLLLLEADGSVGYGNISSYGSPAIDRAGATGRTRVTNLAAGPRLTTTLGDFADLEAVARVRWIGYHADDAALRAFQEDTTAREVTAGMTTGDRYASHEITLSGTYLADDSDFRLYSALASVYVPVTDSVKVVARAGADDIQQEAVIDLQAPIWSVGLEYELNANSYIRVEGGRRYHDNTMAAEARVDVTDRFYLLGSYRERILPAQVALNDSFLGFVNSSQTMPAPLADSTFVIGGPLFNETSRDKVAELNAAYTWPDQELSLTASWVHRRLLANDTTDESVYGSVSYMRRMRPDLRGEVSINYSQQLNNAAFGGTRRYGGSVTLYYELNPTVSIVGGYAYSHDDQTGGGVGGGAIKENVAFASLVKSF